MPRSQDLIGVAAKIGAKDKGDPLNVYMAREGMSR
jgi:hypothetical protein